MSLLCAQTDRLLYNYSITVLFTAIEEMGEKYVLLVMNSQFYIFLQLTHVGVEIHVFHEDLHAHIYVVMCPQVDIYHQVM